MRIIDGGHIFIPAEVQKRWNTHCVTLEDAGDHLIIRPAPDQPAGPGDRGAWQGELADAEAARHRLVR